jgi:DNA-directed RNA polymerase specialized sigma24 family protein
VRSRPENPTTSHEGQRRLTSDEGVEAARERARELVERMRREELAAFQEFFACYCPVLLREARRLGVQPELREEIVIACLDDAAVGLMQHTTPIPRSLAAYLVTALRHDVFNESRRGRRERAHAEVAYREMTSHRQRVVMEGCSEASLRASDGPDWEVVPLAPSIERLAAALDSGLNEDERRLLLWVGQWVPQTLIAEWLGISYGATRARVLRLRTRLRAAAARHVEGASSADRVVLDDFFRRLTGEERGAHVAASDAPAAASSSPPAERPPAPAGHRRAPTPRAPAGSPPPADAIPTGPAETSDA